MVLGTTDANFIRFDRWLDTDRPPLPLILSLHVDSVHYELFERRSGLVRLKILVPMSSDLGQ